MEHKGFFVQLFDVSFQEFLTPKIIKVLYVLAIISAGVYTLILLGKAFSASVSGGFTVLILSPLGFLLGVVNARIVMELILVLFRIAENTGETARQGRSQTPPSA